MLVPAEDKQQETRLINGSETCNAIRQRSISQSLVTQRISSILSLPLVLCSGMPTLFKGTSVCRHYYDKWKIHTTSRRVLRKY